MNDLPDILQVASQLALPLHPIQGGRQYTTPCWACHSRGNKPDINRKGHLTIRPDKGVFRCPRCGYSGNGYTMARDFVGKERAIQIVGSVGDYNGVKLQELEPAGIETRNIVYNAFLDKLVLSPRHRNDINSRGLNDDIVDKNNYKTTPLWDSTEGICSLLIKDGYPLERIPGFFKNREGKWVFMTLPGFLIPVRDQQQRIQGFQIRVDDKYLDMKENLRKYIWFSSAGKKTGCSSGAPVHTALPLDINAKLKLNRVREKR
ncbi:MAG TPA: hypothetical protein GXZ24_06695 [Firmicutes bacterium]|jgi:DNA primase|nr:hypothetical protein [Bacillota bacterium]